MTFGSLNNFCKVNDAVLSAWASILQSVKDSRFTLSAKRGPHRQRVLHFMSSRGIDASRVIFVDGLPLREYMQLYNQIDIALDPFPYVGGTTTCDALWMGTPVITLSGQTPISRGGESILKNIGHPELVAHSVQQYIQIAADLAGDLPRLTDFRNHLREQMRQSPLMNGPRFARNVEAAYLAMWRAWCGRA